MHDTAGTGPIFIVGTQRSGTTLLRLILNSHPRVAIPEEARFLTPLLEPRYVHTPFTGRARDNLIRYIRRNAQFKLWNYDASKFFEWLDQQETIRVPELIDAMYSSYCEFEGKSIWGDKSLFFRQVPVLHAMFPSARFVHIVRDGRDVFDSWRRIDPSKDHAAVVALDWSYKLRAIEQAFDGLPAAVRLTIRYEDLIGDPRPILESVCGFVGVAFEAAMLDFHQTSRRYIGDHHSELIFQPITGDNREKWRRRLTAREASVFTRLARRRLVAYGYPVPELRAAPGDLAWAAWDLARGLPARLYQVLRVKRLMEQGVRSGKPADALEIGDMPEETRGSPPDPGI